jgi:hypothetical protein
MQHNRVRIVGIALFLALMVLVVGVGASQAQQPALDQRNDGAAPESVTAYGTMGVEWITDWPGTADDRANWYFSANNLYNQLDDAGLTGKFNWGETNAWERDWKNGTYGGNGLVDTVDLAMIGTHGTSAWDPKWSKNLSAVYFSSNNDDWYLSPGEAYRYYGTNNLEWLAFDSCSVLRDDSRTYWHRTFNKLHLMLGFANTMYVVYPGDGGEWGDLMQKKGWWIFGHGAKTVTQAWFTATEDQQPSSVLARVLAETLDNYNDYLWGEGYVSPDPTYDEGYWYWDHWSGTPEPLQVAPPPTSMLVYKVVLPPIDEDYVHRIGQAFGISNTMFTNSDHSAFYMTGGISDTLQLRVDRNSGGFLFQNVAELWNHPEVPRTLPPGNSFAIRLAGQFLEENSNYLPGVLEANPGPTVHLEGPVLMAPGTNGVMAAQEQKGTDYAVSYARSLDIGNGQFATVVGPGSRLNVYLGDNDEVIGLKGGWRHVEPVREPVAAGVEATTQVTVPIKTSDEAWEEFLADPTIALAQPPLALEYNKIGKPEPALAYYEQSSSISQAELIPVWIFVADLYTGTVAPPAQVQVTDLVTVATDVKIYVPAEANPEALPTATIIEPAPGTPVGLGTNLELVGEASGGTPPYSFLWSSSKDGILGTGNPLTVTGLSGEVRSSEVQPNTITLLVTDANGKTATDTADVVAPLYTYLPLVLKNVQ